MLNSKEQDSASEANWKVYGSSSGDKQKMELRRKDGGGKLSKYSSEYI